MAMKTMISLKTIKKEGVGDVEEFKNNIQIIILVNKESLIKMERDGDTSVLEESMQGLFGQTCQNIFVCSGLLIFE